MGTEPAQPIQEIPPPKEMIELICMQLRGALAGTPCPDYVLQAGIKFIEALETWAQKG